MAVVKSESRVEQGVARRVKAVIVDSPNGGDSARAHFAVLVSGGGGIVYKHIRLVDLEDGRGDKAVPAAWLKLDATFDLPCFGELCRVGQQSFSIGNVGAGVWKETGRIREARRYLEVGEIGDAGASCECRVRVREVVACFQKIGDLILREVLAAAERQEDVLSELIWSCA